MKNIFYFSMFLMSVVHSFAQADYREKLQVTLDSIVGPYEEMTGADFGPELSFSFKEVFTGVMLEDGYAYSGQLNSVEYKKGDSVRIDRLGLLGGTFAYANFGADQELAILNDEKVKVLIEFDDSIGFWNQFEKVEEVRVRDFAQYWMVLDCQEENYNMFEKVERAFINFGSTTINANVINREDRILLQINFSSSHGKSLHGLGCADRADHFVEFVFGDGTVVKKNNIELEACQILEVDITDDLPSFEQAIMELNFSMSKKDQRLVIDHVIPQNQINLKLDCLTKAFKNE